MDQKEVEPSQIGKISVFSGLLSIILLGITRLLSDQLKNTSTGSILFVLTFLSSIITLILGIIDLSINEGKTKLGLLSVILGIIVLFFLILPAFI